MNAFRIYLAAVLLGLCAYTAAVTIRHGADFLPVFFGDMTKLNWPGQFNLDFMCLLAFSALWVAWRHRFQPIGLLLGLVAFFGGTPFLCVYLLIHSFRSGGDVRKLLTGDD